jgi:protein-L-isoaspartate(D-aspartate) O-methyltransferase
MRSFPEYAIARRRMVEEQLIPKGVEDELVLDAMNKVPRHLFVEQALQAQAYGDSPLPIGEKQTISQPYMVAFMTEALELKGREEVLEIGTGSGYQAAVLSCLARRVYTIERHTPLARRARQVLDRLGCSNVQLKLGDGTLGWAEMGPFDGIMVTAGAPVLPQKLKAQLKPGGRLIVPVGDKSQQVLLRVRRTGEESYEEERLLGCRFVPLVGENGWENGNY